MGALWSPEERAVLRLALAVALAVGLANALAWPVSFFAPILVVTALAAGLVPSPAQGVKLLALVGALLVVGQWLALCLLPYASAFLPLLLLLLFLIQYAGLRGASSLLVMVSLVALLVMPLIGMAEGAAMPVVAGGIWCSLLAALLCIWLSDALVGRGGPLPVPVVKAKAVVSEDELFRRALLKAGLIAPVLVAFYLFQLTSQLVVLIFVAILLPLPDARAGLQTSKGVLLANLLGGAVAVVAFQLLVLAPFLPMLVLLMTLAALYFGPKIFAGGAASAVYSTALNTALLLSCKSTGVIGDDPNQALWVRLAQIGMAVLYVMLALYWEQHYLAGRARGRAGC